jgi:hypothetical protein
MDLENITKKYQIIVNLATYVVGYPNVWILPGKNLKSNNTNKWCSNWTSKQNTWALNFENDPDMLKIASSNILTDMNQMLIKLGNQ